MGDSARVRTRLLLLARHLLMPCTYGFTPFVRGTFDGLWESMHAVEQPGAVA